MSKPTENRELDRQPGSAETPGALAEIDVVPELPRRTADADEPMGGDPPCWAHLFEDDLPASER